MLYPPPPLLFALGSSVALEAEASQGSCVNPPHLTPAVVMDLMVNPGWKEEAALKCLTRVATMVPDSRVLW